MRGIRQDLYVGAHTDHGVFFNDRYFYRNPHPDKDSIWDYGLFQQGADVVGLENPGEAEECLRRDLLSGGVLLEITDQEIRVTRAGEAVRVAGIGCIGRDSAVIEALAPLLPGLLTKHERC